MRSNARAWVGHHQLLAFFIGAFAISWVAWGAMLLTGLFLPLLILGGSGPLIAAILVGWSSEGTALPLWRATSRWRVGIGWYAVAVALPIAVVVMALAALAALGGPPAPEELPPWWAVPLSFLFILLLGGGQEEPGWRGYALPRLQGRLSPLAASLVLGVIWVAWHLPLFLIPGTGQAQLHVGPFAVMGLALSVIFTWLYHRTGGSVLLVMLLHASVNLLVAWYPVASGILPQIVLAACVSAVALLVVGDLPPVRPVGPQPSRPGAQEVVTRSRQPARWTDSAPEVEVHDA